jgi:hypothetical protein
MTKLRRSQSGPSEVSGQSLGQHGVDVASHVDRGRVAGGVPVDGRVLGDQGVDVSHGNEDLHCPAAQILRHRELVEIERVVVVDRAPQ